MQVIERTHRGMRSQREGQFNDSAGMVPSMCLSAGKKDSARMCFDPKPEDPPVNLRVADCKKNNILIMGIGHRIKSKTNPDMRVELVKEFALKHFGEAKVLNFALGVEAVTTSKKANLILNVDGCIAVSFVDMLRSSGAFTYDEIDEMVDSGCLNGLFVLARSAGFIGHFLDQKRMKQPLYRHPWDDITYMKAGDIELDENPNAAARPVTK